MGLIDANKLGRDAFHIECKENGETFERCVVDWDDIEAAPVVNAVEVVRCKDCTQWGGVPFGNICRRWSAPLAGMRNCTGPDDYCSYGERKIKNP